jgi:DNA-binding NarL/FixJ family response regulator
VEILVIDDHALFREGLVMVLGQAEIVKKVHQVESGAEAVKFVEDHQDIDVALLDYNLPGEDSFQILQQLQAIAPSVPVVMLSAMEDADLIQQSIQVGASGFITKTSTTEVMISAVNLVLSGGIYIPPVVFQNKKSELPPAAQTTPESTASAQTMADSGQVPDYKYLLTERQTDVLEQLVEGLSNKEIARVLGMSPSTVKVHVAAILKELNVKNRTQAVTKAQELNILVH